MIGVSQSDSEKLKVEIDATPQVSAISVLVCSDVLAVATSVFLNRLIFSSIDSATSLQLLVGALSFGMGLAAVGLYPGRGVWGPARIRLRALMAAIAFVSPALAGLLVNQDGTNLGIAQCLLVGILVFLLSSFYEHIAIAIADHYALWRSPAFFSGDAAFAQRIRGDLKIFPELGLQFESKANVDSTGLELAAVKWPGLRAVSAFVLDSRSKLPLYHPVGYVSMFNHQGCKAKIARIVKRLIDVIGAIAALFFLAPIIGGVSLLVYLADGKPIFFCQKRRGLNGKLFSVWKFRSMYRDAEDRLQEMLAEDAAAREEFEKHFKLRNDPRVLPSIGHFIRSTSLDEIPQLWNVVKGEMSLVGPRPFPDNHLNAFLPEFRDVRCSVVPGLSGLWQVTTRSNGDVNDQEYLDRAYIEGWSLWLDFYIIFRTPIALLSGHGAM